MPLKMARRPTKSALVGQLCVLILLLVSKVSSGSTTRSQFEDDDHQTVPTTDSSLNVQERNSDPYFDYGGPSRLSSVEAIKSTASNLLHSYEDPINHSLEAQYGASTENSVQGWRDYGSTPQTSKFERYQQHQEPLVTSDGQVETTTMGSQRGMMGDPAQLPSQMPSQLAPQVPSQLPPQQMPTPSAMVQTTTAQQQHHHQQAPGQQQYPERRLGNHAPIPMGSAPMASERIFSFGRNKKKQRSEPVAPIPVAPMFAPMPIPMVYPHQPAAAMVPIQMVAAPQNLQPVRQKRRPQKNGARRPWRSGGRRSRGGRKKPTGKKPGGPQPYGLGSMNLPTYSPAFVSYGPIFGPPPGIQLKHPVHAHQGYGTPTQQSLTYVPLMQHGANGIIQPSYSQHGPHMYSHSHQGPSGPHGPMPILQQGHHGRSAHDGFGSDRIPALTISVEAPSNSYASAPMNLDGSPAGSRITGPSYSSGMHAAVGPHPIPGFGMSVMNSNGFSPSRPLPAPPGVNTGPSYLANPLPVPSSAPMRYLPMPAQAQSKPSYSYNSQPSHGSPHQSSYNPPMHFGPPMHNFGPPMSSLGQPPPIMGEPHIDKWAPPTGYHSYPGNSGYTSHEYSTGPSSYNSQPSTSKYSPSQDYGSASTGSYDKGKYKDFKASIEDPNISYESKYSSQPSYTNSNYNADYSNNDFSYSSSRKKKQRQNAAAAKPYDDFSSGYNSYDTFKATAPAATVAPDTGFPEDDFFTPKGTQGSSAPISRYRYKRRRNSYTGNDSYDSKPASSYSDTSSAGAGGQSDTGRYTDRSASSYGESKSRPGPYYDTHYNSPGMSKDQKVTDWYDYAERTKDQKLKLGYPKGYRRKVLRYRTLPDSIKTYHPDPNHKKYPKLTYDTKHKRLSPSTNDKAAKYMAEETKMAVFRTGPLGGAQRVY